MLVTAHASTLYAAWRIISKTIQILPTDLPTKPNLTWTHPILSNYITVGTNENTLESLISITNTFHNVVEKQNP
jgi:hypothetical protein